MNIETLQREIENISNSVFAKKTDKQLQSYEMLSELYKGRNKGVQPMALIKYNSGVHRKCKLSVEKVKEIRTKYNPYVYGKARLAKEYGVSSSVIFRIINWKSWKDDQ
jgi:hypothetical protein